MLATLYNTHRPPGNATFAFLLIVFTFANKRAWKTRVLLWIPKQTAAWAAWSIAEVPFPAPSVLRGSVGEPEPRRQEVPMPCPL